MFEKNKQIKKTFCTPEEAEGMVGHRFKGGVTIFNTETGMAEIIIDSSLSPELQSVYLVHESVQLETIQKGYRNHGNGILGVAHFNGLNAGLKKAKELGIEEEYRRHRGERVG